MAKRATIDPTAAEPDVDFLPSGWARDARADSTWTDGRDLVDGVDDDGVGPPGTTVVDAAAPDPSLGVGAVADGVEPDGPGCPPTCAGTVVDPADFWI